MTTTNQQLAAMRDEDLTLTPTQRRTIERIATDAKWLYRQTANPDDMTRADLEDVESALRDMAKDAERVLNEVVWAEQKAEAGR